MDSVNQLQHLGLFGLVVLGGSFCLAGEGWTPWGDGALLDDKAVASAHLQHGWRDGWQQSVTP